MSNMHPQNLKLGIFIILGMGIFVFAVYFIGNRQNLFGNNTSVVSVFKDVNGLQTGNNVRFAGVNVGTVRDIIIVNDTSIVVRMLIKERTIHFMKRNIRATVSSDGLVGSMVVNLIPGDSTEAPPVKSGDTIESISKIATADMLETLNTTNENAALLTSDLLKITTTINKGEGTLGALIMDKNMATDIKETIKGLRRTSEAASASMKKLNSVLSSINLHEGVAGVLLKDSVAAEEVAGMIKNLDTSLTSIKELTENLNRFSNDLKSGNGVVDYILNDTTGVKRLDATLENTEEASRKLNENMEALKNNFLFRGYFRKLERRKAKAAEKNYQDK